MQKARKNKGFTLIEVMVALAIMVSLLSLSLSYSRRGGDQIKIFRERARVMQEIARARSLATNLFKEPDEKVCGYGVEIENANTITLFKDLSTSPDRCQGNDQLLSGSDERIDSYTLDQAVEFALIPSSGKTIFFLPPKPDIYFDGERAGEAPNFISEETITLQLVSNPDQEAVVSVNLLGQISTEDE